VKDLQIERFAEKFVRKLGVEFAGHVLDVGCGDGRITRRIAERAVTTIGVDVTAHESWARYASDRLRFQTGDAESLPFSDFSFDTVFQVSMLHHARQPERAITEMLRVRKPGGKVIIVEPNRWNPIMYVHLTMFGSHNHFTKERFKQMIEAIVPIQHFHQFEAHAWPVPEWARRLLEAGEDLAERLPLLHPLLAFNVVIV
jgi:ubiquinone/menaquinone biosynthesis C-methylase UbiE